MIIPMLRPEVSIDDFVDPEEGTRMGVLLADPSAENPVQRVHEIEVLRLVNQALVGLDERERGIIRSRFGLGGEEEQTLEEVGKGLRLSRERVRQIEHLAKAKLRASLIRHRPYLL